MTNSTLESINGLQDVFFVGGQDEFLYFYVFDSNGAPQNITGSTCTWKMFPIGNISNIILSLSGVITDAINGVWKVTIPASSTSSLYGVYQHQPKITGFDGTQYKPAQGLINILPG